ncbi:protein of unknown function [Streptomyces sp. KY75]|nr:protein of unknown function [Streptomyces sp. KY75]
MAAWLRALSTSCRSTFETMSKLESAMTCGSLRRMCVGYSAKPSHRRTVRLLINEVAEHPWPSGIVYVVAKELTSGDPTRRSRRCARVAKGSRL